jgi:hypothetical protein
MPLFVELGTGLIEPGTGLRLKLVARSPDGFLVIEQEEIIAVSDALNHRLRFCKVLEFTGSQLGLWHVQIIADSTVIGEFPFEVREN